MARPKTARGRAWIATVKKYGGVIPAARAWRRSKYARTDDNPYVKTHRRKGGRVKTHWRKSRKMRGFKAPKGWRRAAKRARRNPGNPRVHGYRRKGARVGRHWRRAARRNPPRRAHRGVFSNRGIRPRRRMALRDNPLSAVTARVEELFSTEGVGDLLQGVLGFGGSLFLGKLFATKVIPAIDTPIGRVFSTFLSGLVLSAASGYVSAGAPRKIFYGSLLATAWQALSAAVPDEDKATFPVPLITGMGANDSAFQKAVESEILKNLRGGATRNGVTGMGETYWIQPAGVEEYVPPAGMHAFLTAQEAGRAGMSAYLTAQEAEGAGMNGYDEFSGSESPERF